MEMRPTKCHICTNLTPEETEELKHSFEFHLGNEIITDIRHHKQLTRFLGVHLTMDSKSDKTIDHLKKQVATATAIITNKHCNRNLTRYLINNIIISTMTYRLQVSAITETQKEEFTRLWAKVAKNKTNLAISTSNEVLHHYDLLNINKLTERIDKTVITNLLLKIRDKELPGQAVRALCNLRKDSLTQKLPFYMLPYKESTRSNYSNITDYWNTLLARYKIQIIKRDRMSWKIIAIHVPYKEYLTIAKDLRKDKITHIDQLLDNDKMNLMNASSIQNPNNSNNHMPSYYNIIKKHYCKDSRPTDQIGKKFELKTEYQPDLPPIVRKRKHRSASSLTISIKNSRFYPETPLPPEEVQTTTKIWTDGSYDPNDGSMGAAIVIEAPGNPTIKNRITGTESSTRPELAAILTALTNTASNSNLIIYTDSMNAKRNTEKILNNDLTSDRKLLKTTCYSILEKIKEIQDKRTGTIKIEWVKAHDAQNRYPLNEIADEEAKKARQLFTETKIKTYNNYHIWCNGEIQDIYPAKLINTAHRTAQDMEIKNLYDTEFEQNTIDVPATLQVIKKENKKHAYSFRIKSHTKTLPTRHHLAYGKYENPHELICQNCKEHFETNDHFWQCPANDTATMILTAINRFESTQNKLKERVNIGPYSPSQLVEALMVTNPLITRCSITKIQTQLFEQMFRQERHYQNTARNTLIFTMHCIFHAVFEVLWKNRNDKNQETRQEHAEQQIPLPIPPQPPPAKRKQLIKKTEKRKRLDNALAEGYAALRKRFRIDNLQQIGPG